LYVKNKDLTPRICYTNGAYGEDFSISYILPTDFDGFTDLAISVDDLESVLRAMVSINFSGVVR